MDSLILLAVIAIVPVLLALLFRVSGVFLFLSVAAGNLLVLYLGDDAGLALGMIVRGQNAHMLAQCILLLLPVGLSLFLLKRTLPTSKVLLHVPLLVATGLTLAALSLPLLDSNAQEKVFANQYGALLRESQNIIVGVAAILTLLIMWLTYRHKADKKHKKHR